MHCCPPAAGREPLHPQPGSCCGCSLSRLQVQHANPDMCSAAVAHLAERCNELIAHHLPQRRREVEELWSNNESVQGSVWCKEA